MKRTEIPFNITLSQLNNQLLAGLKPIKALAFFEGSGTSDFHPEGLFSTEIFGKLGDERRNYRYAFIDIKVEVIHPIIYKALGDLKRLYIEIINGTSYAVWNEEEKDFDRSDAVNGQTGMYFFLSHWKKLVFKETKSITREENAKLIYKFRDTALNRYIVVLPAGLRDLELNSHNRVSENEINTIYRRIISVANTITESSVKTSLEVLDTPRLYLQLAFNDLYTLLESQVRGKKKLMLGRWATRRIFNGTRNVITAMDTSVPYLGAKGNPGFNSTIIGLYQYLKATLPVSVYQIRRFLDNMFGDVNQPARLVNKSTLQSEEVLLPSRYYNQWATNDGIERIITGFKEESIRNKPIEINGYYLALLYKGPDNTFKVIGSIDELPEGRSRKDVRPITLTEFLYLSVYLYAPKYPLLVTRYPVTGIGSIYPSRTHLKVTLKSEQRVPLDSEWKPLGEDSTAYEFPVLTSAFVNSLIPHSSRLGNLGADFDGDTSSANIAYSDEAIQECEDYFNNWRAYIGTSGELINSTSVSTVELVLHNMTGP